MNVHDIVKSALKAVAGTAGVPVIYARGNSTVEIDDAMPAQANYGVANVEPAQIDYQAKDFLIEASQLVLDGGRITPRRGDQVRETQGGVTYIYEVRRPDSSEKVWRFSDQLRGWIRVHTTLKGTA